MHDLTELQAAEPEPPGLADQARDGRAPASGARFGKVAVVAADAAVIVAAMIGAYLLRASYYAGQNIRGADTEHFVTAAVALPLWLLCLGRQRLYSARFITRRPEELRRLVHGTVTALLVLAAAGYALQLPVSRAWIVFVAFFGVAGLAIEREVARQLFRHLRRTGRLLRRVVIVGGNDEALELATMLAGDPNLGYEVVGFVHDDEHEVATLGRVHETLAIVRRTEATGVLVATSSTSVAVCNPLIRELLHAGVHVELSSTLRDVASERLTVRPLGRFPVVYLEPRRTAGWRSVAKRSFDLCLAATIMVAVGPLMALISLAVKLDSSGPVIFRQRRIGQDGELFEVRKFRTMVADAEARLVELRELNEADGPLFKLKNDPRVTRVGRLLRKTSLDELPQLWNVLRGEMSLVGPRPALPAEIAAWQPELHARLRVKPGITGMWQVHGRSNSSFNDYSRLDLYYVDNWSLFTDLAILAKTVPAVLFSRGAY